MHVYTYTYLYGVFVCYVLEIGVGMGWFDVLNGCSYTVGSVAAAATAILREHVECGFFCFCFLFFLAFFISPLIRIPHI